ncbi:MAG: 4Fe-4S binding protein [Candidatus Margulisiibacteriota bacterium]|nr:4Fe-4S binding protein [Candidatus Margulisiibacteriota bacterium]
MRRITTDCTGCGACAEVCPVKAIHPTGDKYLIVEEECTNCGQCDDICPVEAIETE